MGNELRIMDDFSKAILKSIDFHSNQLVQTVLSGCKGKIENIYHIMSSIGQIIINGGVSVKITLINVHSHISH